MVTAGAAAYVALPGCVARILQVPVRSNVTVWPLTVQILVDCDARVTGSPEEADGLSTSGPLESDRLPGFGNVMIWGAFDTVNERFTAGAAAYCASPGCVARRVHVPAVRSVTETPLTVQTACVEDVTVTGRPELAVAVTVTGDWISVALAGRGNVMVWLAFDTVKDRVIEVAALYTASPDWLATSVHVPGPTNVTLDALTVQTAAVDDDTVTGKPELAVAVIANGEASMVEFGGRGNVMVWLALVTGNDRVTDGADRKSAFPAWLATIVQVPTAERLIDRPLGLQTVGVFDVSVTVSPELAVAVTASGDWARVEFGGFGKLIVCG